MTIKHAMLLSSAMVALSGCATVHSTAISSQAFEPLAIDVAVLDPASNGAAQPVEGEEETEDYAPGEENAESAETAETAQPTSTVTETPVAKKGQETAASTQAKPTISSRPPDHVVFDTASRRLSDQSGIAYFLPRQLAKIVVKRTEISLDKAIKALGAAEMAVSLASAKVTGLETAIKDTQDAIIENAAIPPALEILQARLTEQKTLLEKAKQDKATKEQELQAARNAIAGAPKPTDAKVQANNAGKRSVVRTGNASAYTKPTSGDEQPPAKRFTVSVNIELMAPSADPAYGYRLNPRHNWFRDDDHKVTVAPNGLLTSTDVVAADRTADILTELATFAGAMMGPGRRGVDDLCKYAGDEITGVVDFTSPKQVGALNKNLACMGVQLKVVGNTWAGLVPQEANPRPVAGIVYRTPVDVMIQINKCLGEQSNCVANSEASDWFPAQTIALSLPQAGPISYIKQNAGALTKTHYALAFKDGILTSYDSSRPSEMLQLAGTPMRIINAGFEGISKVISLRTGQNNALAGLSASQLALLQAQYNLRAGPLAGDKQLNEAQLALIQSQFSLQGANAAGASKLNDAERELLQSQLALQLALINGGAQLSNADLALLQAQTGLSVQRDTAATQLSASDLAKMLALLRDQARRDAVNKCIGEKAMGGEPIESCLAD